MQMKQKATGQGDDFDFLLTSTAEQTSAAMIFRQNRRYKFSFAFPLLITVFYVTAVVMAFWSLEFDQCPGNICAKCLESDDPSYSKDFCIAGRDYLYALNQLLQMTSLIKSISLLVMIPAVYFTDKENEAVAQLGYVTTTKYIQVLNTVSFVFVFVAFSITAVVLGVRGITDDRIDFYVYQSLTMAHRLELQIISTIEFAVMLGYCASTTWLMLRHNMNKDKCDVLAEDYRTRKGLQLKLHILHQTLVMDILKSQQDAMSKNVLLKEQELQQFSINYIPETEMRSLKDDAARLQTELEATKLKSAQLNSQLQRIKIQNSALQAETKALKKQIDAKRK